jgi:hypothetical protein
MSEASENPLSSRKPMGVAGASTGLLKSNTFRNPRGLDHSVIELGGYGLLAYSLFNLARSLAANKLSADPEVSLAVMSNLTSLFPFFLLGPVLVFAPQGAIQAKALAKQLTRWLVAFFALLFFLFTPLSLFQRHLLIERGAMQAQRLETTLQSRKQEILASVQNAGSANKIQQRLRGFPEIRQPDAFAPLQTPSVIRAQLAVSLDAAINREMSRLKRDQQQRLAGITRIVLSISLGSLLSSGFFLLLATSLFPRLKQFRHSFDRSIKSIGKAIRTPNPAIRKFYLAQLSRPQFARVFSILGLQRPRPSRRR